MLMSAVLLGLAGSIHCGAMCGPLAIGGTCTDGQLNKQSALGYAGGRLLAYTFLGAVFGAFGAILERGAFVGARHAALLLVSLFFVVKGLRLLLAKRSLVQLPKKRRLLPFLRLPARGLGLGLFTGLLPCGLLYGAFGMAAVSSSPLEGAAVMFVFALASFPGLFAPVLLRGVLARVPSLRSPQVQGVIWCLLGAWLAVRPVLDSVGGCHG